MPTPSFFGVVQSALIRTTSIESSRPNGFGNPKPAAIAIAYNSISKILRPADDRRPIFVDDLLQKSLVLFVSRPDGRRYRCFVYCFRLRLLQAKNALSLAHDGRDTLCNSRRY
jgi:hypothetical protein